MLTNEVSKNKIKITKDTFILFMGLFYPAISNLIWRILVAVTRLVGIDFSIETFNAIVWALVIGYIILTSRNPKIRISIFAIALLFALTTLFCFTFTDYEHFSVSVLLTLLFGTSTFFFHGAFINLKRVSHKQLYFAAIITLIVSMLYSVYLLGTKDLELEDNMDFAYKVLPSVLVIISWLFTDQRKKLAIIFTIAGTVFLLLQGTRGPLLCLAIFVCLMIYKKRGFGKLLFSISAIALAVTLLFNLTTVSLKLSEWAEKIDSSGYSSRFITMLLDGELSDANGRNSIEETLLEDIKENPFKIRGMFADRQATLGLVDHEYSMVYENGTYAHSLWLELIYDWGVLLGGAILLLLFLATLKLVTKSDKSDGYIIMLFVCTGFIHLFLSGSYLTSTSFFFLVGLTTTNQTCNGAKTQI